MPTIPEGGDGGGPAPAAPPKGVTGQQIVAEAKRFLGDRYVWGAEGPNTFDCSGLMQYSFGQLGVKIPRTSQEQYKFGQIVPNASFLTAGDLVFTEFTGSEPDHVGMYDGAGNVIQAPHTGDVVRITPLKDFGSNQQYRRMPGLAYATGLNLTGQPGQTGGYGGGTGLGSLFNWPADIIGFFTSATNDLEDAAGFLRAFFQPSTYVRIGAGLLGSGLLVAGLVLLTLEAKG